MFMVCLVVILHHDSEVIAEPRFTSCVMFCGVDSWKVNIEFRHKVVMKFIEGLIWLITCNCCKVSEPFISDLMSGRYNSFASRHGSVQDVHDYRMIRDTDVNNDGFGSRQTGQI